MGQKVYCLRLLVKSDSYFTSHFYCCVQECEINKQPSLIIHDVILTDQSGVVLEITTQHETEKKQISRNFHWKRNTLGGYILLLPSFSLLIKCSKCYSKNKLSLTIAFQELYPRLEVPHSDKEQELFGLVTLVVREVKQTSLTVHTKIISRTVIIYMMLVLFAERASWTHSQEYHVNEVLCKISYVSFRKLRTQFAYS